MRPDLVDFDRGILPCFQVKRPVIPQITVWIRLEKRGVVCVADSFRGVLFFQLSFSVITEKFKNGEIILIGILDRSRKSLHKPNRKPVLTVHLPFFLIAVRRIPPHILFHVSAHAYTIVIVHQYMQHLVDDGILEILQFVIVRDENVQPGLRVHFVYSVFILFKEHARIQRQNIGVDILLCLLVVQMVAGNIGVCCRQP